MHIAELDPVTATDADVAAEHGVLAAAHAVEVTEIITGNAARNAHMLRINDRLGFRLWTELHNWQVDAAALADRLGVRPARAGG